MVPGDVGVPGVVADSDVGVPGFVELDVVVLEPGVVADSEVGVPGLVVLEVVVLDGVLGWVVVEPLGVGAG